MNLETFPNLVDADVALLLRGWLDDIENRWRKQPMLCDE